MTELDTLTEQVRLRVLTEPEFADRISRALDAAIPDLDLRDTQDHARMFAVGCIGLALHADDVAAGRWTP